MTHIRKLVSAVCLVLLCLSCSVSKAQTASTLDPTQVYNTGELATFNQTGSNTTSAWQNVGQWGGSLTCWAPGGPGYCGPQPYVNANGYGMINFSYGYTDLYQVVNIANALPNSGTGLRVNGFNFGFTAKNGNGWDGGRQDYLAAYVNFYGANGSLAQSYDYSAYTNRTYNWTNFNFSETFLTPYATKDLSTARYGFVGYDMNGWAGPYGPEIYNVSFSLKYSVDTCALDVFSSPSCPGYIDAVAKLNTVTTSTEPTITTTSSGTIVNPTGSTSVVETTTQPSSTSVVQPASSTTITSPTPSATNPQPKVGEVQQAGSTKPTGPSQSLISSILSSEQSRVSNLEKSVVSTTVEQSQAIATQSTKDAESIASNLTQQSIASSQSNSNQQTKSQTGFSGLGLNFGQSQQFGMLNPSLQSSVSSQQFTDVRLSSIAIQQNYIPRKEQQIEFVQQETKFGTGRNVLETFMQSSPMMQENIQSQQSSSVKKNVPNNELAGGVDLTKMAVQPAGFNQYSFIMPDVAFYSPKEIYRNQKTVDNVRVMRGLQGGTDRLHQEMINLQYNKGN